MESMAKSAHRRLSEPDILRPSSHVSSQSSDWSPDVMEEVSHKIANRITLLQLEEADDEAPLSESVSSERAFLFLNNIIMITSQMENKA